MPTYIIKQPSGVVFLKGELGLHCADCSQPSDLLCDYPIGGGLTCDRSVCDYHGHVVGDNMHYCSSHYREWKDNNPDAGPYQYRVIRLGNLPGYAETALTLLKEQFDNRDTGDRGAWLVKSLRDAAIPLGDDGKRVATAKIPDKPHDGLAGGLAWNLDHGLVEVLWRKLPGSPAFAHYGMTVDGLTVMEGGEIERG